MALQPIIIGSTHPILRAKAQRVSSFGKDLRRLVQDLSDTVLHVQGAGLAAPQVGVSLAVCIARVGAEFMPLINPEISWYSQEKMVGEEGCFSLPNVWLLVPRALEIIVRYQDEQGREQERKLTHFDARVVQHEVDHLLGRLIVDYSAEPVQGVGEAL